MSTLGRKKQETVPKRAYHHGNLRQALLDAAFFLVETGGEEALSLRTVAERAGVSNGAPYRHFEDRQALLSALATIGFDRLTGALARAKQTAGKETAVVAELAGAYLVFGSQNPALYRLMFSHNHLAIRFDAALAKTAAGAFHELESAVRSHLGTSHADARLVATALWSTMHGAVTLTLDRLITVDNPSNQTQARELGAAATQLVVNSVLDTVARCG